MAAFWDKPIVSWLAMSSRFNNHRKYPTTARAMGSVTGLGKFMAAVLVRYNWKRVGILISYLPVSLFYFVSIMYHCN